jgi:hypothetical protein
MISRTKGIPMMEAITIMKTAGRLLSKIEFITVVVFTALALVVAIGGGGGPAAGMLEIFCKAFVALVKPAVAFSKAFVAFPNVLVRFSAMALVVFVVLVDPPAVVADVIMDSLALPESEEDELASACSEGKLQINNRVAPIAAEIVLMYTLFVLLVQ